jgi:hypothetical protein
MQDSSFLRTSSNGGSTAGLQLPVAREACSPVRNALEHRRTRDGEQFCRLEDVATARPCITGETNADPSNGAAHPYIMNELLRPSVAGNPESQATACREYELLKEKYESALRERALYERGGAASMQQAIRYEGEANAVSAAAGASLLTHSKGCPVCKRDRA